jgi:NADH-quinone oxidoreductase subunit N
VLCATILALLFWRLFNGDRLFAPYWVALVGSFAAFFAAWNQFGETIVPTEFFTGLLIYDQFTVFFRLFLILFVILTIALTVLTGIPDDEDGPDFYTLLLGSTIGMMLMASANHLLIVFLGVEMTSVPSYVMVGFLKGRRTGSEAALKYVVYGAGAAGVMLYGISLLAGLLGTANLPELASRIVLIAGSDPTLSDPNMRVIAFGAILVLAGLAFKLSLVPFHFWCPDAFEGAAAEVAGFLSVASKAAAFALLVRFCIALGGTNPAELSQLKLGLGIGLGIIAAVTVTFGNLAAYAQTNMKRLLAYSTIAHAGYMLMAVAALMVLMHQGAESGAGDSYSDVKRAIGGLLFYLGVYLFMNLGAFAIVAMIRNEIYSEEIEDYNGLASQCPFLCVCMLICLFSLVGLPPFGGFFGKWYVFSSLIQAGKLHWSMWALLGIAGLNTVFSLFYYLRVLKAMFISPRPQEARLADVPLNSVCYVFIIVAPVVLLGVCGPLMDSLSNRAQAIASVFFS